MLRGRMGFRDAGAAETSKSTEFWRVGQGLLIN
jgi:hypothetical protein